MKTINKLTDKLVREKENVLERIEDLNVMQNDNKYLAKRKFTMLDLLLIDKIRNGNIDDAGVRNELNAILFGVRTFRNTPISAKIMYV